MRDLFISAFSKPVRPANQWIARLKSCRINSVFLNSQDCHLHLLSLLAKNQIKVFLEFGTFSNNPLLWQEIPEARVVDRNGRVLTNLTFNRKPVCPSNPKVRKIKLENLDKMTQKFSFAGVWLDGLRFPSVWEKRVPEKIATCFCRHCRRLFMHYLGKNRPQDAKPDWPLRLYSEKWYQWRANQLGKFLKEAKNIIKANHPKTKLGVFIVPFTKKEFGNAIIKFFGQNIVALSKHADVLSPMLYHRMCGRHPSWVKKRVKYFSRLTKIPILPAIQTRDLPETLPNRMTTSEFKTIVKFCLSPPSKGLILFTLDNALSVFRTGIIRKIINSVLS